MTSGLVPNFPFCSSSEVRSLSNYTFKNHLRLRLTNPSSLQLQPSRVSPQAKATSAAMEVSEEIATTSDSSPPIKLLFVEMGVGYDQHGCVLRALWLSFPHSVNFFFFCEYPFERFSYSILWLLCFYEEKEVVRWICVEQARHYGRGYAGVQGCHLFQLDSCLPKRYSYSDLVNVCDFHGCVGLDRFAVLVWCWELVFLTELGGESPFKV